MVQQSWIDIANTDPECLEFSAETDVWVLSDEWGPMKMSHVFDPHNDLGCVLIVGNTAICLGKGRIWFTATVTPAEN